MIRRTFLASLLGALPVPVAEFLQGKPVVSRSSRWPKVRAAWLKDHPTCAACGGKAHLEVHHQIPVSWPGGKAMELDPSNFITLCERPSVCCHLNVGHNLNWKSRNFDVQADTAMMLKRIKNRKLPPGD